MKRNGIAIVTGGAGGIGTALCRELAREGYDVVITDYRMNEKAAEMAKSLETEYGIRTLLSRHDLSVYEECTEMVNETVQNLGEDITALINCAGITHGAKFLGEEDPKYFKLVIEANLVSQLNVTHVVLPYMVKAEYDNKNIINFSSSAALAGQSPCITYCASKMGVIGMTKAMANEFAEYGIKVNSIAPGSTRTNMLREPADKFGITVDELAVTVGKQLPLGKICEPEDMAQAMAYLINARLITGMTLAPNSGQTVYSF